MAKDKRVEVLFEPHDYRLLEEEARRRGKSVGSVVREAVARYVAGPSEESRRAAFDRLLKMSGMGGPSGSPEEIKAEILRGYDERFERLYEDD